MPVEPTRAPTSCPECGVRFEKVDPAKHALYHYPTTIPVRPDTLIARQRQAVLTGRTVPEE